VVDLAVLLTQELWLLDFKTDAVDRGALTEKVDFYEPQLRLYALALSRIYHRPIGGCWLHFLATGETVNLAGAEQAPTPRRTNPQQAEFPGSIWPPKTKQPPA
jgi:hypothetical protein